MSDLKQVTLSFAMPEHRVAKLLGDDWDSFRQHGITVEAIAAQVVLNHDAAHGYIAWRVDP